MVWGSSDVTVLVVEVEKVSRVFCLRSDRLVSPPSTCLHPTWATRCGTSWATTCVGTVSTC